MEVSGQFHAATTLPPVPSGYEAVWAPEPVWTLEEEKILLKKRRCFDAH
jgi:hypothetical protein